MLLEFSPHVRSLAEPEGRRLSPLGPLKVCCGMYYSGGADGSGGGILAKLIHPFKYKHQAEIFRVFVPHMREALKLLCEPRDLVLVPVPLHKSRMLERGYNQAELLSKWVARHLGCQTAALLERVRDTGHQATLAKRAERRKNMHGAFRIRSELLKIADSAALASLKNSQIVLVDDIVTSGSTLLACRSALAEAGIKNVSALTLADREKTPQNPWD